jgi:large subunit ribosomal protein L3
VPAGMIGRKLGMTRIFTDDGSVVPVSVIAATPNTVTRLRTRERDGYAALQVGAGTARKMTKPVAGQFSALAKEAQRPSVVREFRIESVEGYELGQQLDVSIFEAGELVDVTGVSKGKGFTGTIARHNFKRGPKTHGSNNYRQPGSIGAGTTPGRVWLGTRMGGHMGADQVTVKKLTVVRVDPERNLLLVRGAVPGARNGLLLVRKAK